MSDYIAREEAKNAINVEAEISTAAETAIEKAIDGIPAADVAPVAHGRWVPFHSQAAGDIQYCSACEIGFAARMNYCPNCGAKMDLEAGG